MPSLKPSDSVYSANFRLALINRILEQRAKTGTKPKTAPAKPKGWSPSERLTDIPYSPQQPHPGKQTEFLKLANREALYGGAGGGGKSSALLMAALQYVDVPGYAALLLRRTYADLALPGALMNRAQEWLQGTDAHWNATEKTWSFPSGATLTFGYMKNDNERFRYQGAELQFCVAEGTLIVMADGSHRRIETVRPGEWVATLQGPRPVTRLSQRQWKPCHRLTAAGRSTIVSEDHRILTEKGWVCPREQRPIQSHGCGKGSEEYSARDAGFELPSGCRFGGLPPVPSPFLPTDRGRASLESGACSAVHRNDSAASDDGRRESLPPQAWSVRAVLFAPAIRSGERAASAGCARHEACHALAGNEVGDFQLGYRAGFHSDGERPHHQSIVVRERTPLRDDAAGRCADSREYRDGQASIPSHSRLRRWRYSHPYTTNPEVSHETVLLSPVCMVPVGVAAVRDLTVAGASHYVTSSGIISQNCGFDELTQFSEVQYRYLFTRLRRLKGVQVPLRVRSATNPGGSGHEWVKKRFAIPQERPEGIWEVPGTKRVWVPALLDDNPALDREEYIESLNELDPVTKAQMLAGDWEIQFEGELFRRAWFPLKDAVPALGRRVRYWDLAATEAKAGSDPDFTVGCKLIQLPHQTFFVADIIRVRQSPGDIKQLILQTAKLDGAGCEVWMEQEPGSSGKAVVADYCRGLAGFTVHGLRSTGSKVTRAKPVSAQAQAGNIAVLNASWADQFLQELTLFPQEGVHDDQVDALSGAFQALTEANVNPLAGMISHTAAKGWVAR